MLGLCLIGLPVVVSVGAVAYYAGKKSRTKSLSAYWLERVQEVDADLVAQKKVKKLMDIFVYLVGDAMHNFNIGEADGNIPDPKYNKRLRTLFLMTRYVHGSCNHSIFFNEIHNMIEVSDELAKEIQEYWHQSDSFEKKRTEYNIILLGLNQIEHYLYGGEINRNNNVETLDEFLNHMYLIKKDI